MLRCKALSLMIGLASLCEELCFCFPTFCFLFFRRLRYLCRWFGVFDSFCGFSMLWILGLCLVVDHVTLRFDLIRIEYSLRLICDSALTGNSDCMEIMILNFGWIVSLLGNCCWNDVACLENHWEILNHVWDVGAGFLVIVKNHVWSCRFWYLGSWEDYGPSYIMGENVL